MSATMRKTLLTLCLTLAPALCVLLATALPAQAETPWWHLSSGLRPGYLHAGVAKPAVPGEDEVQEITAPGEEFEGHPDQVGFGLKVGGATIEEFLTEPSAGEFGFTALTAANVKAALEPLYGPGVQVTQETNAGVISLRIESASGSAPITVSDSVGVGGPSTAKVTNPGKAEVPAVPDGEIYFTAENIGDANVDGSKTPVQFKAVLPKGLKATGILGTKPFKEGDFHQRAQIPCSLEKLTCTLSEKLPPYDLLEMRVTVEVEPGAETGELDEVLVRRRRAELLAEAPDHDLKRSGALRHR